MSTYKIPSEDLEGFSVIMSLSNKHINEINSAIDSLPNILSPSQLVDQASKNVDIDQDDFQKIIKIIYSLSELRKDDDLSREEIAVLIVESLKEIDEEPFKSEKKWEQVEKKLSELLINEEKINLGYKTINLSWEFDKIYVESRIITDIRPVFEDDIEKKINSGIIVHNLKIEYHLSNDIHEKVFIALDSHNLKELKEQIIRAELKEQRIQESLKDYFKIIETTNNE